MHTVEFSDLMESYMQAVVPNTAHKVQKSETLGAFLAGATTVRIYILATMTEKNEEVAETMLSKLFDDIKGLQDAYIKERLENEASSS